MFPEIVLLFFWLGAAVVSGLSEFDCSTGAAQSRCFSDNSFCMSNCAGLDSLFSSNCFSACSSNLNLCTTEVGIACGAFALMGGVASGGGGAAATPTAFEWCQAILQDNDNPAFINVADLQFLVDNASRGNCDNKATLLVEPVFVSLATMHSCGQCLDEDGFEVVAADGSIVGCCNDLAISVEGDGSDLCGVVNLIIQSDCLSIFCVPSQVPECVNAADTCRNACPFNTLEETYSCAEACNTVFNTCFNTCFASLLNTESTGSPNIRTTPSPTPLNSPQPSSQPLSEPQSASTGVGKPVLRAIMVSYLLVSAFFLVV